MSPKYRIFGLVFGEGVQSTTVPRAGQRAKHNPSRQNSEPPCFLTTFTRQPKIG